MRKKHLPVIAALCCCLSACGQKGPLVLPDAQHPRKKIVVPKPPTAPTPAPAPMPTPTPAPPTQ